MRKARWHVLWMPWHRLGQRQAGSLLSLVPWKRNVILKVQDLSHRNTNLILQSLANRINGTVSLWAIKAVHGRILQSNAGKPIQPAVQRLPLKPRLKFG